MPKIIENLENRLIEEAWRQVQTNGYIATTIRSVAGGCGVGVGTVYNYFPSKDDLLAAYILRGWKICLSSIEKTAAAAEKPETVVRCIYDQLQQFVRQHQAVFQDPEAAGAFAGAFRRYHPLLRSQLAKPLERFCVSAFGAEFVTESVLTWSVAGKSFAEIWGILQKLF